MIQQKKSYVLDFELLVKDKNFITFEELSNKLGVTINKIIELKNEFEKQLRLHDDKIRITSRVDLNPPGFEIES